MNPSFKKVVSSIIAQRKKIIQLGVDGKNRAKCLTIIKELSWQIELYHNKWDESGWKNFIDRNIDQIEYLIPTNKSGQTLKNKLYEIK
jgi:hypothetical protein